METVPSFPIASQPGFVPGRPNQDPGPTPGSNPFPSPIDRGGSQDWTGHERGFWRSQNEPNRNGGARAASNKHARGAVEVHAPLRRHLGQKHGRAGEQARRNGGKERKKAVEGAQHDGNDSPWETHLTRTTRVGFRSKCAVHGNFSAPRVHEVAVSHGKSLELLRPDEMGRIRSVYACEVFGCIRSLATFRLPGGNRDYLIVGSDSGRIVILFYDTKTNAFYKVHQETFGRSGCRRAVPGQYVAVDPKGRACMIAAVEKQKFVYVLSRDNKANLTISSPLEAHKSHHVLHHVVGMDCGFDNPIFAVLEVDHGGKDPPRKPNGTPEFKKVLAYYELELGLNHVVRKVIGKVDSTANLLIAVPGGGEGPSGVVICCENFLAYRKDGHEELRVSIPRRKSLPEERSTLVACCSVHRQKSMFFILAQTEYGDLMKITLEWEGTEVKELKIKYLDTIDPCVSICILKSGFLYAASEVGNHNLYQFQGIGDDDSPESSSKAPLDDSGCMPTVVFEPRPLKNLLLVDEQDNFAPITDMRVENVTGEETPQIYAVCGRATKATLRVLRPGLAVTEMAVSPLPGNPNGVWTVKLKNADEFDSFIVVSFVNATLVLSIGETVEEISDSGFLGNAPSLNVVLLADDSLLQAHPGGLRHIRDEKRISDWKTPGRKQVTRVAINNRQAVVALTGGELVYFELSSTGDLEEKDRKELPGDVASLDVAPVPEGRLRGKFLAVGSFDSTVRVMSLDPGNCMQTLAVQAVAAPPESISFLDGSKGVGSQEGLFLNIGLSNGVLLRTEVDSITGKLSDTRARFLGARPPALCKLHADGQPAVLALSNRPWLSYYFQGRHSLTPLSYESLEHASSFASEQCPEGIVAVCKDTLRVLMLEKLGESLNATTTSLKYTPRRILIEQKTKKLVLLEADHATRHVKEEVKLEDEAKPMEVASAEQEEAQEFAEIVRTSKGTWGACIRVVDPFTLDTLCCYELPDDRAAFSICNVTFKDSEEHLLAVGTVQRLSFYPRVLDSASVDLYRLDPQTSQLSLLHSTAVDGIPFSLAPFNGRLLAGVGNKVILFDLGKKKLLKKCELRDLPTAAMTVSSMGNRIFVGDAQEGFLYAKYKPADNQMYLFADTPSMRHICCALHLDYDTMAGGDKFGNFFVSRLLKEASEDVEDDPTGGKIIFSKGMLLGAPHKLFDEVQFHVGETLVSLKRCTLQPGGTEVILGASNTGGLYGFIPLPSMEDVDFFMQLEMHMRIENPPLCGRDHAAFRSSYFPVRACIDGDLCEQFASLPYSMQQRIAGDLDRTPGEVLKKLEDIRAKVL